MKIPEINFPNNDKNFIHDPYPYLSDLREASPLHIDTNSNLTLIPRFDDVKHVQTSKLFSSSDPKDVMMSDKEGSDKDNYEYFWRTEEFSLLNLEGQLHGCLLYTSDAADE